MKIFKDKKWLFVIYLIIAALAGASNFMEPANIFVAASIGLSLVVVLAGDDISALYLLIALCPFYASLRIGGLYAGFVIPLLVLVKLFMKPSMKHAPIMGMLSVLFLLMWFFHDFQFVTFANAIFRLLIPACVFIYICRQKLNEYDGYFAIWIVIATSLISMICIFLVQGGSLDTFLNASYAGEYRLGEADVDEGQKNQLGGAMGFPIYTMIIVSLSIQMLMIRQFKLWGKVLLVGLNIIIFFLTFLTISRVYILGLSTLMVLLFLHMVESRNLKRILGLTFGLIFVYIIAADYLPEYTDGIFESYLTRQAINSDHEGTGIRGAIYEDCIKYLTEDTECFFIGKGSSAYPLYGAKIHRLFSWSAHNIMLDALMAFGMIGTIIIISLYTHLYKREKSRTGLKKWTFFRIMPFACYFMMNMTASPFLLDKTYPMLLFLILNIVHCTDKTEYDPKEALYKGVKLKYI